MHFAKSPDDHDERDEDVDYHIPSKDEIAEFLGLPVESGPVGLATEVGKLTVEQAVTQHALPPEYVEQLHKAVRSKLASVPWPRRIPYKFLGCGRG